MCSSRLNGNPREHRRCVLGTEGTTPFAAPGSLRMSRRARRGSLLAPIPSVSRSTQRNDHDVPGAAKPRYDTVLDVAGLDPASTRIARPRFSAIGDDAPRATRRTARAAPANPKLAALNRVSPLPWDWASGPSAQVSSQSSQRMSADGSLREAGHLPRSIVVTVSRQVTCTIVLARLVRWPAGHLVRLHRGL